MRAAPDPVKEKIDPDNRLYWPSNLGSRVSSEIASDSLLARAMAVSSLLALPTLRDRIVLIASWEFGGGLENAKKAAAW